MVSGARRRRRRRPLRSRLRGSRPAPRGLPEAVRGCPRRDAETPAGPDDLGRRLRVEGGQGRDIGSGQVESLLDPLGEHEGDTPGAAGGVALPGGELGERPEADGVDRDVVDVAGLQEPDRHVERGGQPAQGVLAGLLPAVLVAGQAAHTHLGCGGQLDKAQAPPLSGEREPARSQHGWSRHRSGVVYAVRRATTTSGSAAGRGTAGLAAGSSGTGGRMIRSTQVSMYPSTMESGSDSSARISDSVTWYSSTQVAVPSASASTGPSSHRSMGRVSCRKLRLTASTVAIPFSYRVDGCTCATPVAASPSVAMIASWRSGLRVRARLRGLSYDHPNGANCSRSSRTVREYRAIPCMFGGSSWV